MNRPFVPVGSAWHWLQVNWLLSRRTDVYSFAPDWAPEVSVSSRFRFGLGGKETDMMKSE